MNNEKNFLLLNLNTKKILFLRVNTVFQVWQYWQNCRFIIHFTLSTFYDAMISVISEWQLIMCHTSPR